MDQDLKALSTEVEYLRMDVTALRQALVDAGIPIPSTPVERLAQAKVMQWEMEQAARRNE